MSFEVIIYGPNLEDQSQGDMHVHVKGSDHVAPAPCEYGEGWVMEVEAKEDVAVAVYPPEDFEWDYGDKVQLEQYISDFHWGNSTRPIPRFRPAVDETDVSHLPPLQGGEFTLTNGKTLVVKPSKMSGQWIISVHAQGRAARRVARGQLPSILAGLPAVITKESE